jgi:hypothetical protein
MHLNQLPCRTTSSMLGVLTEVTMVNRSAIVQGYKQLAGCVNRGDRMVNRSAIV